MRRAPRRNTIAFALCRVLSVSAGAALLLLCPAGAHAQSQPQAQQQVQPQVQPSQQPAPLASSALERTPLGQSQAQAQLQPQSSGEQSTSQTITPQALSGSTVQTAIALLLVLTLILSLALLVRWMGKKGMLPSSLGGGLVGPGRAHAVAGLLEVLARYPVGGGSTLIVMKFDRRVLLLHQTRTKGWRGPAQMSTLCELSSPEDVASILLRTRADDDAKRAAEFEAALRREDDAFVRSAPAASPQPRQPQRARAVAAKPVQAARQQRELGTQGAPPSQGLGNGRYA